jgi:hypothetical protein
VTVVVGDQAIDVRAAVAAADAYLESFPHLIQLSSPRLEETETDPDTGDWLITISFFDDPNPGLAHVLGTPPRRAYMQLRVYKNTGHVISMKHRKFAEA